MSFFRKILLAVSLGAILSGCPASADTWRHDKFLTLDLSQAVLSPKMLGPPAQFEAMPLEASAEPVKPDANTAAPASKAARAMVRPKRAHPSRAATIRRNPLDAQASDTRIQVWPCRSGALCNWKR